MWTDRDPDAVGTLTVGSPIYSRDYQKIGTVSGLGTHALKVRTTFLHREFWLSWRAVRSVAADGAVMLTIDKAELGAYKVRMSSAA